MGCPAAAPSKGTRDVWLLVILTLGSVPWQTGCSALFVQPARSSASGIPDESCTKSQGWPTADVIFAVLQGLRTAVALGAPDETYRNATLSRGADVSLGVGLTMVHGISAAYGFSAVTACREANESVDRPPPRRVRLTAKDLQPVGMPPPVPSSGPPAAAPVGDGGVKTPAPEPADASATPEVAPGPLAPPVRQSFDPE